MTKNHQTKGKNPMSKHKELATHIINTHDLKPGSVICLNAPAGSYSEPDEFYLLKENVTRLSGISDFFLIRLDEGESLKTFDEQQMNNLGWYRKQEPNPEAKYKVGYRTQYLKEFGKYGATFANNDDEIKLMSLDEAEACVLLLKDKMRLTDPIIKKVEPEGGEALLEMVGKIKRGEAFE